MDYELFERIMDNVREEVSTRLYEELSTDDLIRYADMESIRKCGVSQNWVFKNIYNKIATGELVMLDSIWTDQWSRSDKKPVFLDVDSYKEWLSCKDNNDRNTYNRTHHRSYREDSEFYDGDADVYCCGHYNHTKITGITDSKFEKDVIGIEIFRTSNDSLYCSDSCSNSFGMKRRNTKCMFTFRATGKTLKERRGVIVELFRTQIASILARRKTDEYMQHLISKTADEVMQVKCEMEQKEPYKYHMSRPINIV